MWGRFRVGVLIVVGTGIAQRSTVSLAGPGAGPGAAPRPGAAGPGAPALRALDKPAFTATPAELLALGKAAPTGDWSMVVLRDQRDVSYDDRGRATVRTRRVYVVQVADRSDDDAAEVDATWHPSYQDRPVLRARVIAPAGTAVDLDPAQVTEPSQGLNAANVDRRYVSAPLPALEAGSVVEQEIVTRDREPLTGGSVDIASIGNPVPTSSTVISYTAPAAARLRHVERLLPAGAKPRHQVTGGRETWSYEIAALPPQVGQELEVPDDVVTSPYVGAATAASWQAVARTYRTLVDQQIAAGPVDLPAELPHAASAEAIAAITAWVHHHVHHKGDSMNEARVPRPPAEIVQAGAGDDGDKATLLVALLRQAGVRADVALVAAGWERRVDPDLPGVQAFDRTLVRARVGARELWIAPGEELARPGQLPQRDQGRRALVIAGDTRALATTPRAASTDNTVRDVRTFVASEDGLARLASVVRYTGVFEIEHRDRVRSVRADRLKKMYGARSESEFHGTLERFASSNAEDLAAPFETTLEVKDVGVVATEVERIEAYLSPRSALEGLPWLVTRKPDAPRGHDYVWPRPQVQEVENRIVVPPGYTLPVPGPDRVRSLGGGTFTEHRELDGQTLIVRFRLDTGKPRITPVELAALKAALQELREQVVHITIEHTAFALLEAGKPREAIAECQRLIALHSAEPLHHVQLARVLLRVGAGEAARREARKAVAMAPGDPGALVGLGWTLSHDTLGRPYTYDWDRAGAIAALRQASKLDPRRLGAAVMLAEVLQHDPSGRLYDGADLAGAADAWRAALAIDKTDERALALARVLVWSEQFAEAEKVARSAGASEDRDRWIVAAIAGGSGAPAAIRAAGELRSGSTRDQLLSFAGWTLMMLQRYDVARELLSGSGTAARGIEAMVAKLRPHPPLQLRPADPRSAVLEMLVAQLDSLRKTPVFWDAEVERALRGAPGQSMAGALRIATARWISDVAQSTVNVEIEGDAGVWRATLQGDGQRYPVYLVLDRGAVKVIGGSSALAGVGRYILRGDARADARARRLLDWLRADVDLPGAEDASSFKSLWGQGLPTSHDAIQLAAAILAGATDPDRVIAVAGRCPSTAPDGELACHQAGFVAYRARRQWAEAVADSEAIDRLRPSWREERTQYHAWVLARAGRFDDADRALDAALASNPNHLGAKIGRLEVAVMRASAGGSAADVIARGDALASDPSAGPWELQYVAWQRLGMVGTPGPAGDLTGALELARKAVDRAPREAGYLGTLAALEAEHGDLDRAIQDSRKAMELRGASEPTVDDWYILGRIEEQLGLTADAVAAYKRVTGTPPDELVTVQALAQRRLAAIARP